MYRSYFGIAVGCVLMVAGVYRVVRTVASPKLSANGAVVDLVHHTGRWGSANSTFYLATDDGTLPVQLSTDYTGANLVEGGQVHVEYVAYTGTVVYLVNTYGWAVHEGDGTITALLLPGAGVMMLLIGLQRLRNPPLQEPPAISFADYPQGSNSTQHPDR